MLWQDTRTVGLGGQGYFLGKLNYSLRDFREKENWTLLGVEWKKADTIPRSTVLFGLGSLFFCLPMFHDGGDVLTELGATQGVKLAG